MTIQYGSPEKFIDRINELIESRYKDEGFGVSELARELNMSRSNLYRKLKAETGISISRYIKKARLGKAIELLCREYITVAEAAYLTGFRSTTYFSRCFREQYGYPPAEAKSRISSEIETKDIKLLHNFPVQTTSFIGREKAMATIETLLAKHRIVTISGTGGCGKTRLVCEMARRIIKKYPGGIWFVDLSTVEKDELVDKQLLKAFQFAEIPGKNGLDIVIEKILKERLLIILDNCEHLINASVRLAHMLISSVPGLSLLNTSRETLGIEGEKVWVLPSLTLPDHIGIADSETTLESEAVAMFIDRARLSNPGFQLVEKNVSDVRTICQMVDGLPLAIELVSSHIKYMAVMTLLERLSDKFDSLPSPDPGTVKRHKTMQAAVEWSYNLLSEEEKILFRRLSVFRGGFDLNAAEEVCVNEALKKESFLDLLSNLVDKSMIQTVYQPGKEMRYRLLETLQRYGSKLLVEKGEYEETRKMHLQYFTRIAGQAYREQFESSSLWLPKLRQEHDNLISALNWAEPNFPEGFRLLAGYLAWYWVMASNLSSGKQYLENAISKGFEETEAYARNLHGLAYITFYFKDIETVFRLFNESRSLWQKFKNHFEEAYVLSLMSLSCNSLKEYKKGLKYSEESLKLARILENSGLIVNSLIYFCIAMVHSKQFKEALPYVEELRTSSEKLNHPLGISGANHLRSDCALGLKEFVEAEKSYGLASQIASKYGITFNSYADLQGVAFALSGQGRWAKSLRINAAAVECFSSIGVEIYGIWPMWDEFIDTYINGAKKEVGEDLVKVYEEEGKTMGFEKALKYALDFSKD